MATVHLWTNHKQFTTKTMKKILFSLAAVAAMVGCAKDAPIVNNNNNNQPEETLAISASIDLSDTRVTIEGEQFTDVKWEGGDTVRLVSVKGVKNTELQTTESGDTNVRFRGEAEYEADVDTYYAVYPSTTITNGVASFDLATQNGKATNAAILAATTKDAAKGVIDMAFKPINALLHVAVTGAPAIKTAEFLAYEGDQFASGFSYDFAAETFTPSGATKVLTVNNPNAEGFFFSLPADLDMSAGYIVRLTDANNNVCSKAYNGKTFEQGTTTRVKFEWSQPTVTLNSGEPKTSYSYYAAGKPLEANKCANNIIYFDGCTYSYANLQDAMIAEVGAYVGNTHYPGGTIDKSNNCFTPNDVTVSSWTAYDVQAYVKTKDQKYFYSGNPTKVYITGLPYDYSFVNGSKSAYESAGWTWNGDMTVGNQSLSTRSKTLVMGRFAAKGAGNSSYQIGYVVSPKFELPSSVDVQSMIVRDLYNTNKTDHQTITGYVGAVASKTDKNQSSISYSDGDTDSVTDSKRGENVWLSSFQLSQSSPYISISCNTASWKWVTMANAYYFLYEAHFRYAQ